MILFFIAYLRDLGFKVPSVFEYTSTRMALGFVTSLLIIILFGKKFIKKLFELKIGDRVREEHCQLLSELHRNKKETPTMGGIIILFSIVCSLFLWMDLKSSFTLLLLLTTLFVGFIGALDDWAKLVKKNTRGISAKTKFLLQTSFALFVSLYLLCSPFHQFIEEHTCFSSPKAKEEVVTENLSLKAYAELSSKEYASRLYIPFLKTPLSFKTILGSLAMALFFVFVITGSSNAVNLTDGLDGLATGTVLLASSAFALVAFLSNNLSFSSYLNILYIEGSGEIAIYLASLTGACLGFLWYNSHPAQVFMGDTGSLALGAILGVSAVLLKKELLLGIIGAVFVAEALSVILQVGSFKLRNKKRIFLIAPLHHHFEYKGWSETKVVIRFWIVGLLSAVLGLITLKFQ